MKAVLFDLDGTLVDSAPDIAAALDAALETCGHAAVGEARARAMIGGGAARLIHRALTGHDEADAPEVVFEPVLDAFLDAYADKLYHRSRLYDGVLAGLEAVRTAGFRTAVVTNKPAHFTAPLLDAAGIAGYLDVCVSGDTLAWKKPRPEPLWHALERLGVARADAVMVGDSLTDVTAAHNADLPAICVSYGYARGAALDRSGCVALIDTLAALPAVLTTVLTGDQASRPASRLASGLASGLASDDTGRESNVT